MPYGNWDNYRQGLQAFYRRNPRAAAQYAQPGLGQGQAAPEDFFQRAAMGAGGLGVRPNNIPGMKEMGTGYTGAPVAATDGLGQPGSYGGELSPNAVNAVAGRFPTPVQAGAPGGFGQAMSRLRPGMGGTLGEIVSAPGGGGPGGLFGGAAQSLGSRFGGPKGPVTLGGGRQMSGGDYDEYVRQREARRAGIRT